MPLSSGEKLTQIDPIDWASPYLWTPEGTQTRDQITSLGPTSVSSLHAPSVTHFHIAA
jgi:hypothetical protein